MERSKPLVALALCATLLFAGCIGSQTDAELSSNAVQADVVVAIEAEGAGDVSHLGLELDRVLAHDANVSLPDGFHDLSLASSHADLVHDGEATRVELASGSVPAGGYDQVLLRVDNATVEKNASDGGHDHGAGDDGHEHDDGGDSSEAIHTGAFDLPINASFEALPAETTHVTFVLDVEKSLEGDSFDPELVEATVERGNETVETQTNLQTRAGPGNDLPSDPPATRIAVFAPNGDQIYEPPFDPEDGEFANSPSSAIPVGEEMQFSGTDSEPVAKGAQIASYEWDLDDGTTATGPTVSHAYENPGVYEVELTVQDSYGNVNSHQLRVVTDTEGWTTHLVNTSFEEGADNWTSESDGESTGWALDGSGPDSDTAWRAGFSSEAPGTADSLVGYESGVTATLHSPEYQIPEDWTKIGFEVWIAGTSNSNMSQGSPAGDVDVTEADPFRASYTTGSGEEVTLGVFSGSQGWTDLGEIDALEELAGDTIQFHFTFETQEGQPAGGDGWYVDDLAIGGVDLPVHKAHLLEDSGHDGHDHEH